MDFNKALFGFIRVAFSIMIALLVLFAGIVFLLYLCIPVRKSLVFPENSER